MGVASLGVAADQALLGDQKSAKSKTCDQPLNSQRISFIDLCCTRMEIHLNRSFVLSLCAPPHSRHGQRYKGHVLLLVSSVQVGLT